MCLSGDHALRLALPSADTRARAQSSRCLALVHTSSDSVSGPQLLLYAGAAVSPYRYWGVIRDDQQGIGCQAIDTDVIPNQVVTDEAGTTSSVLAWQ